LEEAGHGTLVLFDELMGGTDPDEGAALATATVEALVSAGASVCVTTHYEPLKNHAQEHPQFKNGAVGFDFDKMEPTFLVTMGRPGASSALVVAERFGLASTITQRALTLMPEQMATERQERIAVESITARLENERAQLQILRDTQADLNRRLERQLSQEEERQRSELLREGDALRIEIKAARAELRRVQQALKHAGRDELSQIQAELDRAARIDAVGGPLHQRAKNPAQNAPQVLPSQIVPGVVVRVAGFSTLGEVLEPPKKGSVRVLLGVMKMNVALTDISLVGAAGAPPPKVTNHRPHTPVVAEPGTVTLVRSQDVTVDLRGQRVEDGLLLLDQFIEGMLHHHEPGGYVLHGHGTGAMKEAVRSHLRAHACVTASRAAERDEGGDAFTVFWLNI
jgi:DNA mismatch repair protein MutS2